MHRDHRLRRCHFAGSAGGPGRATGTGTWRAAAGPSASARRRRSHRVRVDLRRHLAERLGRRSGVLARGQRRADRGEHDRESGQAEHVPHLARRRAAGLRAESGIPPQRDEQRHSDSQRPAARRPGHRQVGDEGISGRHRRREPVHRPDLRGARPRVSRDARPGDAGPQRRPAADHRQPAAVAGRAEGADQDRRLEPGSPGRARQHDYPDSERRGHEHAGRRGCEEPPARWPDRVSDARRRSHACRVPQHLAQDTMRL